jgi:hypothetical protein
MRSATTREAPSSSPRDRRQAPVAGWGGSRTGVSAESTAEASGTSCAPIERRRRRAPADGHGGAASWSGGDTRREIGTTSAFPTRRVRSPGGASVGTALERMPWRESSPPVPTG